MISAQREGASVLALSKSLKRASLLAVVSAGFLGAASVPAAAHYYSTRCDRDGDDCYRVRCDNDGDDCDRVRQRHYGSSYGYGGYGGYGGGYYQSRPYLNWGYYNNGYEGNHESREHEEEEEENE
jgi:hypothetical protein